MTKISSILWGGLDKGKYSTSQDQYNPEFEINYLHNTG